MLTVNNLDNILYQLWGKYSKTDNSTYHPLIYHMLDAAAVALEMWDSSLSQAFKSDMASSFGLSIQQTGLLVAYWIGLHDIGKCGPEFQRKNPDRKQVLADLGLSFPTRARKPDGFHATATTSILRRLFQQQTPPIPRKFRSAITTALGGHHGEFPSNGQLNEFNLSHLHVGDESWQALQSCLASFMQDVLQPACPNQYPETVSALNAVVMQLTGFTTASDWIASNEDYFAFTAPNTVPCEYFKHARVKAHHALESLGWLGWKSSSAPRSFQEIFPGIETPNSLQNAVIAAAQETSSPFLAIIESQTGSGKTEAALYLADHHLQQDGLSGLYIAMPTQATSNQMHARVKSFLSSRYPEDDLNLHLVHGSALLHDALHEFMPSNIWAEEEDSNIHSHGWFLPRKKTLLAPFGVGTVDQAFYAVLRSKFFFLRLFGLSHKVLVFDEVHAYDTYMNEIFVMLLQWLAILGTSVIILTATLPESSKSALLQAFTGRQAPLPEVDYPRLTLADAAHTRVVNAGNAINRVVRLSWVDKDIDTIARVLSDRLKDGGCAAVICNTVKRAQQVYARLQHDFPDVTTDLILFHSSFPFSWRKEIEDKVLRLFGKDRRARPHKSILVATQVIEQSLDLDFDLLITDLAPIDLLIQRIGRLHRHAASDRPLSLSAPECIISAHDSLDATLSQGGDIYVYDAYTLGKTWCALRDKPTLTLPLESDALISYVYEDRANDPSALETARDKLDREASSSRQSARNYLLPGVEIDFISSQPTFFGDDPQSFSRQVVNAPTREIDPTIQIVCLERKEGNLYILDDPNSINLNTPLTKTQMIRCLLGSATVSNRAFVSHVLSTAAAIPQSFRQNAALRWHFPFTFINGRCEVGEFELLLDRQTGLSVHKLNQS